MVASNAIFAAGSGQGVYGGTTTAAVTLTSSGSPIADGVVQFLLGGVSAGEADTNANGVASLNGISLSGLGAGTHASELKAVFAGYTTASHTQTYAACSVSTSVIIGRAQLTITANNQSKVYGAAVPTLTASYAGLVSGDTSASLTTQPTLSTSATSASRIFGNPYKITVGGAADSNYIIHYVTGTLTVTPAPLTITAVNETKAYGAALPALTGQLCGLRQRETRPTSLAKPPTLSTTATAHSHVSGNPYSITVGGAVNPNYAISYVSGTLTVTPAPLTITASDKAMLAGGTHAGSDGHLQGPRQWRYAGQPDHFSATFHYGYVAEHLRAIPDQRQWRGGCGLRDYANARRPLGDYRRRPGYMGFGRSD